MLNKIGQLGIINTVKLVLTAFLVVLNIIFLNIFYNYYNKDKIIDREVYTNDLKDRLLGYVSGLWSSYSGDIIEISLLTEIKYFKVNDNEYKIIVIDGVDEYWGTVNISARDKDNRLLKIQLNKQFKVPGLIVVIFDPIMEICKGISSPVCARSVYWKVR